MRNYRDYAGELSYGDERPATTSGYNRPGSAHRSNSQKGLHNLNEESSGLGKTYGKGQTLGGGEKRLHLGRGKNNRDEEELSSLSGFTASDREEEEEDHDDHNEIKWSMAPKNNNKKNKYADSDEEEEEEENRDIMLKPHNDLQERFREHDMMRRKGEQEKQEQKILAQRNAELLQNASQTMPLKRPNSSHGALRTSTNMSRTFLNGQKENMNIHNRPQTSYNNRNLHGEEEAGEYEERKPVTFKPIYTKTIRETLINKKVYNYKDKNFKTIAKKSDPVSRINAFKNEWNKTKFLKANNTQQKEGRKLNLAERNQTSKPDFIFHKYKSKYNMD